MVYPIHRAFFFFWAYFVFLSLKEHYLITIAVTFINANKTDEFLQNYVLWEHPSESFQMFWLKFLTL